MAWSLRLKVVASWFPTQQKLAVSTAMNAVCVSLNEAFMTAALLPKTKGVAATTLLAWMGMMATKAQRIQIFS